MKLVKILLMQLSLALLLVACQSEEQLEFARYYSSGSLTYQNKCQNCHGKSGEGLGELIPPLTDTLYLKAHKELLACIIKNGLADTISISHKTFVEKMPAVELSPVEIAGVITYVTNSFKNKQGTKTASKVASNLASCR